MQTLIAMMKKALLILVLLFLSAGLVYAQSSVSVTQKGNGNSVIINRNTNNSGLGKNQKNCNQVFKELLRINANKILVRRADGTIDTLVNVSGRKYNVVKKRLGKQEIVASQDGNRNGLSIVLPDSQKSYKKFESIQKGSKNRITARLNKNIRDVTILQKGKKNNISINPCKGRKTGINQQSNTVQIMQKGSSNSATVVQN